jgi:L-serine deaminase
MNTKQTAEFETIRNHIKRSELSDEEKSNSYKHIEEWYTQDKAFGTLYEALAEISPAVKGLLGELGLM